MVSIYAREVNQGRGEFNYTILNLEAYDRWLGAFATTFVLKERRSSRHSSWHLYAGLGKFVSLGLEV